MKVMICAGMMDGRQRLGKWGKEMEEGGGRRLEEEEERRGEGAEH